MKSYLKNYRQSSRKVRLVADLIRGKGVERAEADLKFLNKRASKIVGKLLNSAVSNAKANNGVEKKDLFVKKVEVNEGPTLRRIRLRARGSAYVIRKRTSNISLILDKEKKSPKSKEKSQITNIKSQTKPKPKAKEAKSSKLVAKN